MPPSGRGTPRDSDDDTDSETRLTTRSIPRSTVSQRSSPRRDAVGIDRTRSRGEFRPRQVDFVDGIRELSDSDDDNVPEDEVERVRDVDKRMMPQTSTRSPGKAVRLLSDVKTRRLLHDGVLLKHGMYNSCDVV